MRWRILLPITTKIVSYQTFGQRKSTQPTIALPNLVSGGWQDPSKKIANAISKDKHIGIKTVYKSVEYLVVLVKKGVSESEMPVGTCILGFLRA